LSPEAADPARTQPPSAGPRRMSAGAMSTTKVAARTTRPGAEPIPGSPPRSTRVWAAPAPCSTWAPAPGPTNQQTATSWPWNPRQPCELSARRTSPPPSMRSPTPAAR
jgi:hypothetical protein